MGFSVSVGITKDENKKVKGVASVVIDNSFKISNITIVDRGEKGLFVAMPALKVNTSDANVAFKEVCHPVTKDFRDELYNKILATYAVAASGENEKKFQKFSTLDVKDEPELAVWSVSLVNDSSHPTLKGTANIALNGNFVIENMPIRENKEGEVFLAMPSYRNNSTGEFHDIVNPVSKEFREKLQQAVLEKYEKAKEMEVNLLDGGKEDEKDENADINKSATKDSWESKIANQKDAASEKASNDPAQEQKPDMYKGNMEI